MHLEYYLFEMKMNISQLWEINVEENEIVIEIGEMAIFVAHGPCSVSHF